MVVTGSNTGVGFETARQLALGGVDANEARHIILACRTPAKAQAAVDKIVADLPAVSVVRVEWMQLDVTDFNSIHAFVDTIKRRALPVHVLVNNAGVNLAPKELGQPLRCEKMFVANYLGAFLLTRLLLPVLETSAPSRIVNVSSFMHRLGKTDFERAMRGRTDQSTYSSSKLAQIFHAHELQRRYAHKGISVFVTHPGACFSDIWNTVKPDFLRKAKPLLKFMFLTTEQGAKPSVHAATKRVGDGVSKDTRGASGEVEHFGPYRQPHASLSILLDAWQPSCLTRVTQSQTAACTYDKPTAEKLWAFSEQLCQEWAEAAKAQ